MAVTACRVSMQPRVIIWCDGGHQTGHGHISRGMALASAMRGLGWRALFVTQNPAPGPWINRCGFDHVTIHSHKQLFELCLQQAVRALIVDLPSDINGDIFHSLQGVGIVTAVIDCRFEWRRRAALAFYPHGEAMTELNWSGYTGRVLAGLPWMVLRGEFMRACIVPRRRDLLICAGASDPFGLTVTSMYYLNRLHGYTLTVVVGPQCRDVKAIERLGRTSHHDVHIEKAPSVTRFIRLLDSHRLGLMSFGITAYESARRGLPALYMNFSRQQIPSARAFSAFGFARNLGFMQDINAANMCESVSRLLAQPYRLRLMGQQARRLVDGCGASRIAVTIARYAGVA